MHLSPIQTPALVALALAYSLTLLTAQPVKPSRSATIAPLHSATFNKNGKARERRQGGNPRTVNGIFMIDGSMDGNRQVDPQVVVGTSIGAVNGAAIVQGFSPAELEKFWLSLEEKDVHGLPAMRLISMSLSV